jgi:hypothetical protein
MAGRLSMVRCLESIQVLVGGRASAVPDMWVDLQFPEHGEKRDKE